MNTHETETDYDAVYAEEAALMEAQGLIEWLMEDGVSQKDLADRLGISQSAVSQLLSDEPTNLTVKRLGRIIHALGDELIIISKRRQHYVAKRTVERAWTIPTAKPRREFKIVAANDCFEEQREESSAPFVRTFPQDSRYVAA